MNGFDSKWCIPKMVVDFGVNHPLKLAAPHFQTNPNGSKRSLQFAAVSMALLNVFFQRHGFDH